MIPSQMTVLVLGSGGREHAIVRSLAKSSYVETIMAAPGNGGTALEPKTSNIELDINSPEAVAEFAVSQKVDLVVIGPEVPLVKGVGDAVREWGIAAFGPGQVGAQLEGSKSFSKDFMVRHNVPTAKYHVFGAEEREQAFDALEEMGVPVVIKADGLAAGKGVTVATDMVQAQQALADCYDGQFGDAGDTVVIEECLDGPECSLLAFVDGHTMVPMATAQDHKRVGDADTGPNTGGMGVYSPVPLVHHSEYQEMVAIMQAVADALVAENIEYRGILYGGFMLTKQGPQVLEFNCRFGDPETQVLLPRLKTDLAEVMWHCAQGELDSVDLEFDNTAGVSVVMASGGYPGSIQTGFVIEHIDEAEKIAGVQVFHAGTKRLDSGEIVTAGGRVLNVTALAPTFEEAIDAAYQAVDRITFQGAFCRTDIGQRALLAQ